MTRYYREFQYIICSSMGTKIVVLQQLSCIHRGTIGTGIDKKYAVSYLPLTWLSQLFSVD